MLHTSNGMDRLTLTGKQAPDSFQGCGEFGNGLRPRFLPRLSIVGGPLDNGNGAVWVYTRSDGVWTQQGNKLVGTGAVGNARQGISVALSADGNTAIAGGTFDNNGNGAVWVFVQPTEDDCKDGGWLNFPTPPGPFTNQGQCVSYFASQP
jgi:hypothetical protein